jgi:hypothetical protein
MKAISGTFRVPLGGVGMRVYRQLPEAERLVVVEQWPAVDAVANALLDTPTLSRVEVESIIA